MVRGDGTAWTGVVVDKLKNPLLVLRIVWNLVRNLTVDSIRKQVSSPCLWKGFRPPTVDLVALVTVKLEICKILWARLLTKDLIGVTVTRKFNKNTFHRRHMPKESGTCFRSNRYVERLRISEKFRNWNSDHNWKYDKNQKQHNFTTKQSKIATSVWSSQE